MKLRGLSNTFAPFAIASSAFLSTAAMAQSVDFKQFVKPGSYSMTIKVLGPNASTLSALTPPASNFCVTEAQLANNQFMSFKGDNAAQGTSCVARNVKQTKDSLSYDLVCEKEGVTASNVMKFADGNMKGTTKTKMTGEKAAGLPAEMREFAVEFESKYLGACK